MTTREKQLQAPGDHHVAVIFENLGGYHVARLKAANVACLQRGWSLTAIELTNGTVEHDWGDVRGNIDFPLVTLEPEPDTRERVNVDRMSRSAARDMGRALDYLSPDVVVLPGWGRPAARSALRWCRRHGAPAVLMSETKYDDAKRHWWKEKLKAALYIRRCEAALVGGELSARYLISLGIPSDRIFMGYDVVDNDYFRKVAARARQNSDAARAGQPLLPTRPYFVSMSRLVARKNVRGLLQAYLHYRRRVGDEAWNLVLCGKGEETEAINAFVREHGLEDVVVRPGFVPYEAVGDWYGLAEAFIHPALVEPWGLVVNEACASGLPVLCSRTVGAADELVRHGESGFTFDPFDVRDIADKLVTMHELSPEERQSMGRRGQEIVGDFGPERFACGLMAAIDTAFCVHVGRSRG